MRPKFSRLKSTKPFLSYPRQTCFEQSRKEAEEPTTEEQFRGVRPECLCRFLKGQWKCSEQKEQPLWSPPHEQAFREAEQKAAFRKTELLCSGGVRQKSRMRKFRQSSKAEPKQTAFRKGRSSQPEPTHRQQGLHTVRQQSRQRLSA